MTDQSDVVKDHEATIYVDLDGTLIRSDMLAESLLVLLKQNFMYVAMIPYWLLRGRAYLKEQIAIRAAPRVDLLPYNDELVRLLKKRKQEGRRLVLATASSKQLAMRISDHLGLFHDVMGSDAKRNLKGGAKLEAIVRYERGRPFDYIGDSEADLSIFESARSVVLVNPRPGIERRVTSFGKSVQVIRSKTLSVGMVLRSIRLYQWVKNVLIFVPLFTSHNWFDVDRALAVALGFVAFGCCASAIYVLNDLFDLDADRAHPVKRQRAFANGDMAISHGLGLVVLMLAFGLSLAYWVNSGFFIASLLYVAVTTAYTLSLKRVVLIDVIILAGLYTTRVVAGAQAIDVSLSFWLLAFSTFLFLSLSLLKRCGELVSLKLLQRAAAKGRDYRVEDFSTLREMGLASGYMAVLVVALYINDPSVKMLYQNEKVLWLLCPLLLYWISRMWLKTARGEMHSDPIVYALKDRISVLVAVTTVVVVIAAKG